MNKLHVRITILRTFFEAEAETLIPPLVFASVMMLKPAFHRWRFKIVRTVGITYFTSNTHIKIKTKTCTGKELRQMVCCIEIFKI